MRKSKEWLWVKQEAGVGTQEKDDTCNNRRGIMATSLADHLTKQRVVCLFGTKLPVGFGGKGGRT